LQTKVRTVKEAENLIFNLMFAIEGVTAASAQLDSLALDLDGYKQIEVGIDKGNQSFAPIYLSLRFCQTARKGVVLLEKQTANEWSRFIDWCELNNRKPSHYKALQDYMKGVKA